MTIQSAAGAARSSVILRFALGPTIVKYAAFGQLENRICLRQAHERHKEIEISPTMIHAIERKKGNGLGRRLEIAPRC
jgi:hypothetical protein